MKQRLIGAAAAGGRGGYHLIYRSHIHLEREEAAFMHSCIQAFRLSCIRRRSAYFVRVDM